MEDGASFRLQPHRVVALDVLQDAVEQIDERLLLLTSLIDVVDELLSDLLGMCLMVL